MIKLECPRLHFILASLAQRCTSSIWDRPHGVHLFCADERAKLLYSSASLAPTPQQKSAAHCPTTKWTMQTVCKGKCFRPERSHGRCHHAAERVKTGCPSQPQQLPINTAHHPPTPLSLCQTIYCTCTNHCSGSLTLRLSLASL